MLFDLHVHSTFSPCSVFTVERILARARSLGLDGVCITDHHTMEARRHVREGVQEDGLCVVIGMEYTTPEGDFLLFGVEGMQHGLHAQELLHRVADAGGVAVAAHPFRHGRGTCESIVHGGLCTIIETMNGRNSDDENRRAEACSRLYRLNRCAGSDAHEESELGRCLTRFTTPVTSTAQLVAALKQGLCAPEIRGQGGIRDMLETFTGETRH